MRTFDVHDYGTPDYVPSKLPPLAENAYFNLPKEPERGPLYVLLYDMVNTDERYQPYARQQMMEFINNKPPGTRFAIIVLSDGMYVVQGFTQDKDLLLAALNPDGTRPHVPKIFIFGGNFGRNISRVEVAVFNELAHYLEGFPGRKNVISMSGRFPLDLFGRTIDNLVGDGDFTGDVKEAVDTMARNQIAIYPVDDRGLVPEIAQSTNNYERTELAKQTGGRAFVLSNNLVGVLEAATANGGDYYTLSYSPTNTNYNGRMRKLKVELANRSYDVAYRRSYFGLDRDFQPRPSEAKWIELAGSRGSIPQSDPLSIAMRHGGPMVHDLIFRAEFHAVGQAAMATPEQVALLVDDPGVLRSRKGNQTAKSSKPVELQSYTVDYLVLDSRSKEEKDKDVPYSTTIELATAAFDSDGKMISGDLQQLVREASPIQPGAKTRVIRIYQKIDVPVQSAWVRVAVRDLTTNRTGTLEIALPLLHGSAAPANAPGTTSKPASFSPGATQQRLWCLNLSHHELWFSVSEDDV